MRHTPVPAASDDEPTESLAAMLDHAVTRPSIGDWLSSPTRDIHARLVHFDDSAASGSGSGSYGYSYSYSAGSSARGPPSPTLHSRRSRSRRSSSSMAPACIHQSSTASQHPPSLYNYSDATPTETSIETGLASHLEGVPLLEDVNGVLERRANTIHQPVFECAFWFLSCSYISSDADEWRTHCLSHFRGEEPPRSVSCPLCADFRYTSTNGWSSWEIRMEHVGWHHAALGHSLRTSRPEFGLYQHLWAKRLIDDEDLKELKGGNWDLRRGVGNVVVTNGRREREGRGERRRQHVGARRG